MFDNLPKDFTDIKAWAERLTSVLEFNAVSKDDIVSKETFKELLKRVEALESTQNED